MRRYEVQPGLRDKDHHFVRLTVALPMAAQVHYMPKVVGSKAEYCRPDDGYVPPELDADPIIADLLTHGMVDEALARWCRRAEARLGLIPRKSGHGGPHHDCDAGGVGHGRGKVRMRKVCVCSLRRSRETLLRQPWRHGGSLGTSRGVTSFSE